MSRAVPARPALRGLLLASAFCVPAWCADAQAIARDPAPAVGISQEQFLALMGRLDALEKRNQELEARVVNLQAQSATSDAAINRKLDAGRGTLTNGRPTLATSDGEFSASLRGVMQLDVGVHDQRSAGPQATDFRRGSVGDAGEADRARDLSDGANFRRVRLGIEGKAWGDWVYNFLMDFGGSGVEEPGRIINAYVEYTGLNPVRLRAGAFAPLTNFDDGTTAASSLFLERPAPAELVRAQTGADGRTAVALLSSGERWNAFAAVTGNVVQTSSFDDQLGVVGRVTWLPVKTKTSLLHVGANLNLIVNPAATGPDVAPGGAPSPVRLRERPEVRLDSTRLIDTGSIDAEALNIYGVELGWQMKSLSLQGEYFWLDLKRRNSGLADPNFNGLYVQGAWTITGEPRRYLAATGGFDIPRVETPFSLKTKTWGAWELAARYTDLDLNYRAGAPGTALPISGIRGGEQKIVTVGLNWYPNNNVRFLADYQRVEVNRLSPGGTAFGAGALTPPAGAQIGQDLNIWSFRTQYAF